MPLLLALLLTVISTSNALVETAPRLETFASRLTTAAQAPARLTYRIAVGDKENPFQMKGMQVELCDDLSLKKKGSTGIHNCRLLQKPTFINDRGEQTVDLANGGWEVTWARNSPHGHLMCSFVVPQEVRRNNDDADGGATLEAGRFYIRHRVWTSRTLAVERERRREIQSEAAKYLDERDQKIKEITDTDDNVASKTWSYAQAAKSMSKYRDLGVYEASFVPLYDDQVLELLPDDCILSSRGQVFKVRNSREGAVNIGESRVEFPKNNNQ